VEDSGNSRFVLMHAVRLHCWVHTKECRFFTLLDWFEFDCIFAVTDGISVVHVNCCVSVFSKQAGTLSHCCVECYGLPESEMQASQTSASWNIYRWVCLLGAVDGPIAWFCSIGWAENKVILHSQLQSYLERGTTCLSAFSCWQCTLSEKELFSGVSGICALHERYCLAQVQRIRDWRWACLPSLTCWPFHLGLPMGARGGLAVMMPLCFMFLVTAFTGLGSSYCPHNFSHI